MDGGFCPRGWAGVLPFCNFFISSWYFVNNSLYYQMKHNFCRNLSASLRLLLFYICFCSLLIDTRLVFISYFASVHLRKGHTGLEYQCSFIRLYLLLFAFLIICIETFGFSQIFCNITSVACEDWSPVWYSGLWG